MTDTAKQAATPETVCGAYKTSDFASCERPSGHEGAHRGKSTAYPIEVQWHGPVPPPSAVPAQSAPTPGPVRFIGSERPSDPKTIALLNKTFDAVYQAEAARVVSQYPCEECRKRDCGVRRPCECKNPACPCAIPPTSEPESQPQQDAPIPEDFARQLESHLAIYGTWQGCNCRFHRAIKVGDDDAPKPSLSVEGIEEENSRLRAALTLAQSHHQDAKELIQRMTQRETRLEGALAQALEALGSLSIPLRIQSDLHQRMCEHEGIDITSNNAYKVAKERLDKAQSAIQSVRAALAATKEP